MHRAAFLRSLGGFVLLVPAGRLLAAELSAGDGRSAPRPVDGSADVLGRLRARRTTQIERVVRYRARGVFPRNRDFEGLRIPYFVDDRGVACAVANLMIQDGLQAEVDRIARANNHVRVMDVTEGALVDWVVGSGLTQEEAARIQPGYDFMRPPATPFPIETPEDPAIVERQRIQRHLAEVIGELRRNTETSLATAVERFQRGRAGG